MADGEPSGLLGSGAQTWIHGWRESLENPLFDVGIELRRHIVTGVFHHEAGGIELVGDVLLGSILKVAELGSAVARVRFTLLFIAGTSAGALLLHGAYGINKNAATPSYGLWACAVTASLWLLLYLFTDVRPLPTVSKSFALAGRNVLLAYLFSEALPSVLAVVQLRDWYHGLTQQSLACAITRSVCCAVLILAATLGLNRIGFHVRL